MHSIKMVLMGAAGVGKSSLILRWVRGIFNEHMESTIGAAFLTKSIFDRDLKIEIWDTAGQERYSSLSPMYYRQSSIAIVVVDITDINSFKIPAGKQIKIPNANTIAIVDLGSLNLSEIKKYNNIIRDGTIVIASVYISHYIRLLL